MVENVTCYNPQHRPGLESDNYRPCWSGTSDGYSVCCPQGWICSNNLLCVYTRTGQKQVPHATLQRGLCTDKTFKSRNCPQFCLDNDQRKWLLDTSQQRLTRIPDHNNGTAIKNCGNGSGCCHTDVNQDCRYSVGSARALLLEAQSVVSYTAEPSSPVTLWLSGTAVSVSTPSPVVRSTFTTGVTVTSTSTYTTERVSVSSMRTRSTRSNTITPVPTIHNLIAVSTAVPVEVTAIPSSSATAINSSEISNLGLMIGLPIGIPIVLTFLIVAFFLFRRYVREDKANQHEVDAPAGCQWSQDKERFEDQKWDYKTITTRKYSPNPRFSICNKPLPIPKLRASRETLSVPFVMYELPGDDWLAKELPGSPDPSWEQRYELG